jgi:hypothetical protein
LRAVRPRGCTTPPVRGAVEGDDRFEPIALQPEEPRLGRADEDGVGHRDARAFEVLHPGDRVPLGVGGVPDLGAVQQGPQLGAVTHDGGHRATGVLHGPGVSTVV